MALVPGGREVFGAHGRLMERLHLGACVNVGESHGWIESVDGLRVGDAELGQPRGTICGELSKVHIERAIFLQHKKDVLDYSRSHAADGNGRRLGDGSTIAGRRGGGVGGSGCGINRRCALLRRA